MTATIHQTGLNDSHIRYAIHYVPRPAQCRVGKPGLDNSSTGRSLVAYRQRQDLVASGLRNNKITEEGVKFRSHLDGSPHLFTPEKVMEIEMALGADIAIVFDVSACLTPPPMKPPRKPWKKRTNRWAERCLKSP